LLLSPATVVLPCTVQKIGRVGGEFLNCLELYVSVANSWLCRHWRLIQPTTMLLVLRQYSSTAAGKAKTQSRNVPRADGLQDHRGGMGKLHCFWHSRSIPYVDFYLSMKR